MSQHPTQAPRKAGCRGPRAFSGSLLAMLLFASASAASTVQVSDDDSGTGCGTWSPVANGTAGVLAWQSDCDPTGGNADGSVEIFRAVVGSSPTQVTSGAGCTSSNPTISSDGNRIAFESNCDLVPGANPDRNVEIFLSKNGVISQLTSTLDCDNLAPSINGAGTFIAFDSNCLTDTNLDVGYEIFRASHNGAVVQLTRDDTGDCDSTSASIDATGNLVAFDSDCDHTGENEDFAVEIFTVTSAGAITQRTKALDDTCSSVRPSMDGAGTIIAFQSDCDYEGLNPDGGDEIFTVQGTSTPHQVTEADDGVGCASSEPQMSSSGKALVFSSYCPLNGRNSDGSIEVFHVGAGTSEGGILAVTETTGTCSSLAAGIDSTGTLVAFDSDCDLAGANADASVEAFRAKACVCAKPSSRDPGAKKAPKASDALYTLRSAVGISGCALCECDTDSSGSVTAADALRVLKAAVGQVITLACP